MLIFAALLIWVTSESNPWEVTSDLVAISSNFSVRLIELSSSFSWTVIFFLKLVFTLDKLFSKFLMGSLNFDMKISSGNMIVLTLFLNSSQVLSKDDISSSTPSLSIL